MKGQWIKDKNGRDVYLSPLFLWTRKNRSKKTREKISQSCIRKGVGKWMIGKKLSGKTKKKISENNARYWLGKTGKNHAHWKNERKNPLLLTIRQCFEYRQWRIIIYKRDNYSCVLCKRKKEVSGQLEADHFPKQFIDIINENQIRTLEEAKRCKELWNVDNGRTLCKKCHNPSRGKGQRYKIGKFISNS